MDQGNAVRDGASFLVWGYDGHLVLARQDPFHGPQAFRVDTIIIGQEDVHVTARSHILFA